MFIDDAISRLNTKLAFRSSRKRAEDPSLPHDLSPQESNEPAARRSVFVTRIVLAALFLTVIASISAYAEAIHVTCDRENITAPGWTGPLTVAFEGDPNGSLVVRSEHTQLDLRGSMQTNADDNTKMIWANEDTKAIMPDLADLDACSASKVPKDIVADADFFNVMSMSCLETVKLGAEPVPIKASVNILVFSAGEVNVEIRRTYHDPSKGPGGVMYIENYAGGCKVGGGQQ